jgi:hypothetical protein
MHAEEGNHSAVATAQVNTGQVIRDLLTASAGHVLEVDITLLPGGCDGLGPYRVSGDLGPVDQHMTVLRGAGYAVTDYWEFPPALQVWTPVGVDALRADVTRATDAASHVVQGLTGELADRLSACTPVDQAQIVTRAVVSFLVGHGLMFAAPPAEWARFIPAEILEPLNSDLGGAVTDAMENQARINRRLFRR